LGQLGGGDYFCNFSDYRSDFCDYSGDLFYVKVFVAGVLRFFFCLATVEAAKIAGQPYDHLLLMIPLQFTPTRNFPLNLRPLLLKSSLHVFSIP